MTARPGAGAPAVAVGTDVAAARRRPRDGDSVGLGIRRHPRGRRDALPGALALGRLIVSLAILGTVAAVRRGAAPGAARPLWIATFGVLWLAVYSVALNEAERRVDAGTAAMLVNTGPILIAIFAGIFLREGFPPGLFAGCAVAFVRRRRDRLRHHAVRRQVRPGRRPLHRRGVRLRRRGRRAEARARTRVGVPGDVDRARRRHDRVPAVRADARDRGRERRCRDDRLDGVSRRRADGARLRDLGVRAAAHQRGPNGIAHVPGPADRDRPRLGRARRDAAVARGAGGALCLAGVALARRAPRS